MPQRLKVRQEKIQAKRKHTPWREFVMEIASWYTINLNKNQGMVSRYPETDRIGDIVLEHDYQKIGDQMTDFNYMPDKSFLDQLFLLRKTVQHPNRLTFSANQNSDHADVVFGANNAYLSFTIGGNVENILYSTISYVNCRNVFNSIFIANNSENIFASKVVSKGFNVFYSKYISSCSDIRFSSNLIGCSHCIQCDNLVNQSYCIKNKQYTKDEYMLYKKRILSQKEKFDLVAASVNNHAINHQSSECIGAGINNSSHISWGYYVDRAQYGRNIMFVHGIDHANNYYDVFEAGVNSDDFYAVSNAGTNSNHLYCCTQVETSSHLFYSYHMESCSYCLGCIGLKNKSYCIFNKQYTKEERYDKVDEIFSQMEKDGTLGQFFPGSMNPFYFNDTAAYLIDDSFTKEEVTAKGYLRRDEPIHVDIPEWMDVVEVSDLENYEGFDDSGTRTIDPTILKKVIRDEQGNVYRVIKMEYDFLVKYGLPLPRKHRLERLKEHFRVK